MLTKLIDNQKTLKDIYYNKLDKLRETFDFNNQELYFNDMQNYATLLKEALKQHFSIQEKLKNNINENVDKLILENMLVKEILLRMSNKIIDGANKKDINIFAFFDDFEEIFKAYLQKEKGLFLQQLNQMTNTEEKEKIKSLINSYNS